MHRLLYEILFFPIALLHLSQADPSFYKLYDVYQVKCTDLDLTYEQFVHCGLKTVRKTKLLSINVKVLQPPVYDAFVNFSFLRITKNGVQPFMFSGSGDFCKYINGRKNFLYELFLKPLRNHSNVVHSCPFTSDLYIKDLAVNNLKTVAGVLSGNVNNEASYAPGGNKNIATGNRNVTTAYDANRILGTTSMQCHQQQQQQQRPQQSLVNVSKVAATTTITTTIVAVTSTPIFTVTTATTGGGTFGSNFENELLKQKQYHHQQQQQQQQQLQLQQLQKQQQRFEFHAGQSTNTNNNTMTAIVSGTSNNCNGNDVVINKLTTTASIERHYYQNGKGDHQQQQQQNNSPYATLPRTISGIGNGDLRHNGNRNGNARTVAGVINTISGSIPATGFGNGRVTSIGSDLNLNSALNNSCMDLSKLNGNAVAQRHRSEDYRFTRITKDTDALEYSSKRSTSVPHPCTRFQRSNNNGNGYLWILTPVAASISVAIVIAALAGPQWLFTEEKLPNSLYNGTANFNALDDGAYITKYTKSSLWILCTTLQGIEKYNCVKIDYFSLDGYQPDPHDSTSAIPYTVTKSCPFFLASGIALLISFIVYLIPTCSHQNSLYYFSAGIMFIVSGLLMLIGLIAYISILKSEIGSKLRARSPLQPPLFKVNYGQSFFLFVFGFVATEFVGLLNIFLYISLQEISYYSRLPCFTLSNIREKIKEGQNPRSHSYKSFKHTSPTDERKSVQRMRTNGSHHQVHSVRLSMPQQLVEDMEHKKSSLKTCRRHPNARDSNNIDLERRYYFDDLPSMKCNLHSRSLAKSLNELYTEPVAAAAPPPPSAMTAMTLPRQQQTLSSNIVTQFADLPQEFPLTRSVSTTTDIFQNDNNGYGNVCMDLRDGGHTPHLERKSRRNMATNTRPTDTELLRKEFDMRQLTANRRQRYELSNNDNDDSDNVVVIDANHDNKCNNNSKNPNNDDADDNVDLHDEDDEEPQRLCGLKRGIRKTKDELFQEFCKRAGMRPKPKNIYYIANEEEMLRRKRHIGDLGAVNKTSGLKTVLDELEFNEEDDGFKQSQEHNRRVYGIENNTHSPLPTFPIRNVRRASMFAEPAQLRKLNSNLSLHTFYPPDNHATAYQKGFYDASTTHDTVSNDVWPAYPEPLRTTFGGSQSRLDAAMHLQQNRATLPRSFLKNSSESQDSIASASLQALNNAYSASQTRLTTLQLQQSQQQQFQQNQQQHLLSLSRDNNSYLHKSYDDLNASNYIVDTAIRTPSARLPEIYDKLQPPVIQWPTAIPSSPSNFSANYQIYGPAKNVHSPLAHPLVTRSISGGGGATSTNGQPKFQRAFAFDEQRRPSVAITTDTFDMDERERRRSQASLYNGAILIGGHSFTANNNAKNTEDNYDLLNGTAV